MVDVEKLAFVSKDNMYYCILDESLYAIDLEKLQYAIITTKLKEGRYEVSSSSSMIAWQEGENVNSSDKLYLMNLNTTL